MSGAADEVFRRFDVAGAQRPRYVVWELTLACDQRCTHCGSRAGRPRSRELTTQEALGVVEQLAELGTFECALIGGEAYLHPGLLDIVRALRAGGVRPTMTTGGWGITERLAGALAEAGLYTASVSVDGLEATHDLMRGQRGSFAAATSALRRLQAAGVRVGANSNFNRLNQGELEGLYACLQGLGIVAWQVQLTTPLGRAADRPELAFQPYDLLDFFPRLAALKARAWQDGVIIQPGNNLGYFGPEEAVLRSPRPGMTDHFQTCQAGRQLLGIESDGAVKGCPSLQSSHYVGGNLRERRLDELWKADSRIGFTRRRGLEDLWGFCRTCPFAVQCLGGCSFTAHALLGRPGNNPLCHYRARALAQRGLRERLVLRSLAPAPQQPFDCAQFDVVEEPLEAPEPEPEPEPRLSAGSGVGVGG